MGIIKERVIGIRESVKHAASILYNHATLIILCGPFNPFGCGYTTKGLAYHDHRINAASPEPPLVQIKPFIQETYDKAKHGDLDVFIKEGDSVPGQPNSTDNRTPTHRHTGRSASGPYEYRYE